MAAACDVALKEWAVLCQALATGRQAILLRKGGLLDRGAGGGFRVEHRAFFLFPTYFHERRADVIPAAHADMGAQDAAAPPPGQVTLSVYAEVAEARFIDDRAALEPLAPLHLYAPACVDARHAYRTPGLWVLLLRAHRLDTPHPLAVTAAQAGCVSWVHLDAALSTAGTPALDDDAFARLRAHLADTLGPA